MHSLQFPTTGYFDATIYAMLAQAGGLDFYNDALKYDANTWTSDEGKKVLDTVAKTCRKKTIHRKIQFPMQTLTVDSRSISRT